MAKEKEKQEKKTIVVTREELCEVREHLGIIHRSFRARQLALDKLDALIARFPAPKVKAAPKAKDVPDAPEVMDAPAGEGDTPKE